MQADGCMGVCEANVLLACAAVCTLACDTLCKQMAAVELVKLTRRCLLKPLITAQRNCITAFPSRAFCCLHYSIRTLCKQMIALELVKLTQRCLMKPMQGCQMMLVLTSEDLLLGQDLAPLLAISTGPVAATGVPSRYENSFGLRSVQLRGQEIIDKHQMASLHQPIYGFNVSTSLVTMRISKSRCCSPQFRLSRMALLHVLRSQHKECGS